MTKDDAFYRMMVRLCRRQHGLYDHPAAVRFEHSEAADELIQRGLLRISAAARLSFAARLVTGYGEFCAGGSLDAPL